MSYRDWYVGMKLVALRDGYASWERQVRDFIVQGRVYTIAAIDPSDCPDVAVFVYLEGSPTDDYGYEPSFECNGFRPVQPRATDISIFTAMLTGTKRKVDA